MVINRVGRPEPFWGDEVDGTFEVTFGADDDLDCIATIRFLNDKGQEVGPPEVSRSRMAIATHVVSEQIWTFAKVYDSLTIEITYWMDMKALEVPFDLSTSVGLPN